MSAGSKRKREPEAIVADNDLSAASDVWKACFGKDGNFTVIVKEVSQDTSEDSEDQTAAKRTEFKVWSFLLAQWSPVFRKMVGPDNYTESQKAEVIITDFSARAVEIFLRFMYSGSVGGSVTVIVEVAAMADKYQVEALHSLCLQLVRQVLKPKLACKVFATADLFHVASMRTEALDLIFTNPEEALKERPALRPELLEEILISGLLCTSEDAMRQILQGWGEKDSACFEPILSIPTRNEHSDDVLATLWDRYGRSGRKGAFLGCWVVVILDLEQGLETNSEELDMMAANQWYSRVRKGRWVQWLLPHSRVHLQGFSFSCFNLLASASFRIWSSDDGATWHLAYESLKTEIKARAFLPCKRPPGLVKWFKLEVLEGEWLNDFNIHGILQTPV